MATTDTDSKYEIIDPSPSSLVESNRAFGYSPETSIADLIDNSITAGAKTIWIDFDWKGQDSCIHILDDGTGMTEVELKNAMRLGSSNPLSDRDEKDLGRFGLGLKTASFAQCRSLTVATLTSAGIQNTRIWDLDIISETDEWRLLSEPTTKNAALISQTLSKISSSGTLVIWDRLDRMVGNFKKSDVSAKNRFYDIEAQVSRHLSMVFHRYMVGQNKISIYIGGNKEPLTPWDPFLTDEDYTDPLPEQYPSLYGTQISVAPYVLPHHTTMSSKEAHSKAAGIKGWNAHQGFYVYRNRRMLVAGSWLGIRNLKQEEHYKLARIKLDIPNTMDEAWELDVKKSEARPPAGLRDDLTRIANVTRNKAVEVYRFRGKPKARKHADDFIFIWEGKELRSRIRYSINRNHPLVTSVKSMMNKNSKAFNSMLKLIEETVPITKFWVESSENPDSHIQYFEGKSSKEIMEVMMDTYSALIKNGFSHNDALEKMPTLEVFDRYPELLALLAERVGDQNDRS